MTSSCNSRKDSSDKSRSCQASVNVFTSMKVTTCCMESGTDLSCGLLRATPPSFLTETPSYNTIWFTNFDTRFRPRTVPRPPCIHHCTSQPYRFFGRAAELALLDEALAGAAPSLVALGGPGGQGKTAIMQHWLEHLVAQGGCDGVFLWS